MFRFFAVILTSTLVLSGGLAGFALAGENSSVNVKNNVSATANSGGNKIEGSGTIETGDATASVGSKINVSGSEGTDVSVEATAQAGGEEASVKIEKENIEGDIKIEERQEADGAVASAEIEVNQEESGGSTEGDNEEGVGEKIKEFFEGLVSGILSLFR